MKRTRWAIGLAVVGVAASAIYFRETAEAETPRFATASVTRGSVVAKVEATGTLQPVDTVEVGTQVTGTIKALNADFNSVVRKGQVIATLDPAVLQSQVDQARATVVRLRADLERAKVTVRDADVKLARATSLSQAQLLPQSELDTAQVTHDAAVAAVKSSEAQLVQAQASLDQSQVNLSHTIIAAPVDGIVLSRNVEVGQTVAAGLQAPTLFVIARDLGTMQVYASVDEADIGRVQPGQPVSFTVDAYGADRFSGKVRQIRLQPVVAQNVVSYTTVIDVPNPAQKLKPGMTATVSIEVGRADDALRVPAAALRFRPASAAASAPESSTSSDARARQGGRGLTVWVNESGALRPVRVQTLVSDGAVTAIATGALDEHAQVVTGMVTSTTAQAAPQSSSPLMPSFQRRNGGAGQGSGARRAN